MDRRMIIDKCILRFMYVCVSVSAVFVVTKCLLTLFPRINFCSPLCYYGDNL